MAKTRFRTGVSRGLGVDGKVDRENHIIHGVAVCSPGEAKGHGVHVDREFTADVVRFGQDGSRGQRSRFGHPAMSANALGTHLGRVENFRDVDGVARGDLHFNDSAAITPSGDLRDYVETLAESDPDAFGMSIVFSPGARYKRDDGDGGKVTEDDPRFDAIDGPEFIECADLSACDVVDDPAANDGLFHTAALEMDAGVVAEFFETNPNIWEIVDNDPDAFAPFLERYKAHRTRQEQFATDDGDKTNEATTMLEDNAVEETETTETTEAETTTPDAPEATETETVEDDAVELAADDTETRETELAQIAERFGKDTLLAAVTGGLSFHDAQALHLQELEDRVKLYETGDKLPDGEEAASGGLPSEREISDKYSNLPGGLARFAAGVKLK